MLLLSAAAAFGASQHRTPAKPDRGKSAESIRDAKGKELVEDICTLCHELHRVTIQHLSEEEWRGLIKGMIAEGAPVTDEEFSMIVDYLAKNFGDDEK